MNMDVDANDIIAELREQRDDALDTLAVTKAALRAAERQLEEAKTPPGPDEE